MPEPAPDSQPNDSMDASIDASLRRLVAPPPNLASMLDDAFARVHESRVADRQPPRFGSPRRAENRSGGQTAASGAAPRSGAFVFPTATFFRVTAAAAVVTLGSGLLYLNFGPGASEPPAYVGTGMAPHVVTLASEWDRMAANGFEPDWVCDVETLRATAVEYLGHPVSLDLSETTVASAQLVGVSFVPLANRPGIVLLGTVDGENVLVFVDQADRLNLYRDARDDARHRFERQEGNLVFIEYSNLESPVFLPALRAG